MSAERIDVLALIWRAVLTSECVSGDEADRVIAAVYDLIESVPRAIEMLCVAGKHCNEFASDETTFYDETDCDGTCIDMDCESVANHLRSALARIGYTP